MIIEPGLLTHPKFLLLQRALGKKHSALELLVRLWLHCQAEKRGENWGKVDQNYVEMVAGWEGDPGELWALLTKPLIVGKNPWVRVGAEGEVTIHGWNEANGSLIANWHRNPRGRGGKAASKPPLSHEEAPASASDSPGTSQGGSDGHDRHDRHDGDTHTLRSGAEIPSEAEALEWSRGHSDLSIGNRAVPDAWLLGWLDWQLSVFERTRQFPTDWRASAARKFRRDVLDRHPVALGEVSQLQKNTPPPTQRLDPAEFAAALGGYVAGKEAVA